MAVIISRRFSYCPNFATAPLVLQHQSTSKANRARKGRLKLRCLKGPTIAEYPVGYYGCGV